jgi:hypothetical protein
MKFNPEAQIQHALEINSASGNSFMTDVKGEEYCHGDQVRQIVKNMLGQHICIC